MFAVNQQVTWLLGIVQYEEQPTLLVGGNKRRLVIIRLCHNSGIAEDTSFAPYSYKGSIADVGELTY